MPSDDQDKTTEPREVADAGEATEAAEQPITESLEDELARLRAELDEAHEKYLRAVADFDNSRKRLRAEYAQRSQFANELLVTELLPVLDNLERALAMDTATDATSLRSGVELTARMFAEVLVRFGVKPIQAAGQLFDPTKHEAIAQEESAEHAEGTVIEELQRGYLLHDRVIRPSMVRVASAASANASRQEVES